MSGDIRSLAQRFELPRDSLNSIKDMTGTYQEKLTALDALLTKFGISNEVITAQLGTTARTFDQLASKADNAKVALGGVLATALKIPAQGVGNFFQSIADGLNSFNKYVQGSAFSKIDADIFASTKNLDEFNAKLKEYQNRVNSMPGGAEGGAGIDAKFIALDKLKNLTNAQYQFAMQVRATGVEWDTVAQKVREVDSIFQGTGELVKLRGEDVATADALATSLMFLASTSSEGAVKARELSDAVANGSISAQMATIQANILSTSTRVLSDLNVQAASSSQQLSDAQKDEATTATEDAINKEILEVKTKSLADAALAAANQIIATNGVMSLSGIQSLQTSRKIDVLTAAYLRLANAKAQAEQGGGKGGASTGKSASIGGSDLASRAGRRADEERIREENLKQREEEIKAEQEYQYHIGNTAQKLKILRDQLSKTTDVAEQYKIKQQIFDLENEKTGGGGGGKSPKLTAQEKLNNQLAGNQDSYYDKIESAELKHQQNVLKIQEEYAEKQLEAQKQNEVNKRRSRYDFYSSLQDIPASDAQKYSAQYEEAYRKSQEMAQQGQQRLAKEYLDMRQKQIEELKDLESEKRDVQENDDMSRKEKEAAIRYIEERKKLLEDAQREEEKQLLEGGDANQKELQERLADEDRAYADNLESVGLKADQLADRRIAAWERANKKIAETPPAELTNYGTNSPSPVVSAGSSTGTPVAASDIFMVRDQGVIDSIGDQTARLEGKLDSLKTSVDSGLTDVSKQINSLQASVRTSKGMVTP